MIAAFAIAEELEPGVPGAPHNVTAVRLILKSDGSGKANVEQAKIMIASPGVPIVIAPVNDRGGLAIRKGSKTR